MLQSAQKPHNDEKATLKYGLDNNKKPEILISYRMEGKEAGKGAYYDHHTVQHHTGYPTATILSTNHVIKAKNLKDYISNQTTRLPHSPVDATLLKPVPTQAQSYSQGGGLLFIPGMTRDSYENNPSTHKARISFEKQVIKDALNRGRPIIAVCAGSWTLWESAWELIEDKKEIATVAVEDHNYGAGMPRIGAHGTMTHNKLVHDVVVEPDTLLQKAMGLGNTPVDRQLSVNSIHWRAPDASKTPTNFTIVAKAHQNQNIVIQTRQATVMTPEANTVEAFETKHGAPVIGIEWHPEAFDWTQKTSPDLPNRKCLLFMAKAGHAFSAKQEMIKEFKETVQSVRVDEVDDLENVFNYLKI